MIPGWSGHRNPRWIVQRLDKDDAVLRTVPFESGSCTISAFSLLGGSATISFAKEVADDFDWFRDRVSVTYDPGTGVKPWPVGVYLPAEPGDVHGMRSLVEVELLPKTVVVDDDSHTDFFSVPKNTRIVDVLVDLIESTGESRIAVTESDARTSSDLVFEPDRSKLSIWNELATSANYGALWTDGTGQFRVEPYVDPADRPLAWEFTPGDRVSLMKPDWTREQDLLRIPNRVVVMSPGDQDDPPIIGVAENRDPESKFSIPYRGRVRSRPEEVPDLSSVEAANAHARRLLAASMSPVSTLSVEHAIVPVDPGARIRYVSSGREGYATVREMSFPMTFEAEAQALWREL